MTGDDLDDLRRLGLRRLTPVPSAPASSAPDRSDADLVGPDIFGPDRFDPDGFDSDALLARLGQALPAPSPVLLVAIGLLSAIHLVLAAPWAVGADPFQLLSQTTTSHQTRDGAVGVVVAVAGILTVWRPRWALPCFALAAVALIGQLLAGLVDATIVKSGVEELIHTGTVLLTTFIGLAAVRFVALGPGYRPPRLRAVNRAESGGRSPGTARPARGSGPGRRRPGGGPRPTPR